MRDCCILISSSDNTIDVFEQTIKSYQKYWPQRPFPTYIGLNSDNDKVFLRGTGISTVCVPATGSWSVEIAQQLSVLREKYKYVILFLDDFFITSSPNNEAILGSLELVYDNNMKYLRLIKITRSVVPMILGYMSGLFDKKEFEVVSRSNLYYSSLQVAIWDIDYLVETLGDKNIWEFEYTVTDEVHYAVTHDVVKYIHVVEKGVWMAYSSIIFRLSGLGLITGFRKKESLWRLPIYMIRKIRFYLFGYFPSYVFRFMKK